MTLPRNISVSEMPQAWTVASANAEYVSITRNRISYSRGVIA
jgi:hypothetical protein